MADIELLPQEIKVLLAPYFPGFNLNKIRIHHGIPWYVPMKASAYTDRNHIYFAPGSYDPYSAEGIALIAHEIAHSVQYENHGIWMFRQLYIRAWLVELCQHLSFNDAYSRNPFEAAARALEERVYNDLFDRLKR